MTGQFDDWRGVAAPSLAEIEALAADAYARLSPIMEWDVAAGDCVFRYSGANGARPSPLTYNTPDLRIPRFVIGMEGHSVPTDLP